MLQRILFFAIFFSLVVIDTLFRFPVLDDQAFTNGIKSAGVLHWIVDIGLNIEGRFFSPLTFLQAFFIWFSKSNVHVLIIDLVIIFLLFRASFRNYWMECLMVLLTFIVFIRYAAFQTLFWQSGITYFIQLAFLVFVISNYSKIEKTNTVRYLVFFLIGTCTYQVSLAFILLYTSFQLWNHFEKANRWFDFERSWIIKLFFDIVIIAAPLIVMVTIGNQERLNAAELNDSTYLLVRAIFYKFKKWLPEWYSVLIIFFLLPFFFDSVRKSFQSYSDRKLLFTIAVFFLAAIAALLPTAILRGYFALRISIYWGFLLGISIMLLGIFSIRKAKLETRLDQWQFGLRNLASALVLLGLILYSAHVFETIGFNKIYRDREKMLTDKENEILIIKYKGFTQEELHHYFGYSDKHMMSTSWMKEIYMNQYHIKAISWKGGKLVVNYK